MRGLDTNTAITYYVAIGGIDQYLHIDGKVIKYQKIETTRKLYYRK